MNARTYTHMRMRTRTYAAGTTAEDGVLSQQERERIADEHASMLMRRRRKRESRTA